MLIGRKQGDFLLKNDHCSPVVLHVPMYIRAWVVGLGGLPSPFLPEVPSLSDHPTVLPPLCLTSVYPSATPSSLSSVQICHFFFLTKHKLAYALF